MHTLEQALEQLVKAGRVTAEQAIAVAANPVHMRTMLGDYAGTTVEELRLEAALAAGRTV
jgi:Tfp pilus assembly ATPase PilU